MKKILTSALIGFVSGLFGLWVGIRYYQLELISTQNQDFTEQSLAIPFEASYDEETVSAPAESFSSKDMALSNTPSFIEASSISTSSVVFIQTIEEFEYRTGSMFDWFFEPRTSQRVGSGSGVIFSEDGYIVTNNHVIEDADVIKVTIGKRTIDARLIGRDPSTDLAVIKVEGQSLPAIPLGLSEETKVGQWVLAVGNPFNLTSTVTAGIVSAKGRNINILKDKFPIESFIQTDAAINPGNSGGALVNEKGELIGINTAILSRTGSYAGYGFAVPIAIVKKVFDDIVKYGEVQKAFTGADFVDIDSDIVEKLQLSDYDGVIIANVQPKSAADKAKLERGDVLKKVNGKDIENKAFLEEYVGNLYPGDELKLTVLRDGRLLSRTLTLTNIEGTTGIIKRNVFFSDYWQAKFEAVPKVERELLGIRSGIKVLDYDDRGFFAEFGISKGFIITAINNTPMDDPEELATILEKIRGRFTISGITSQGREVYYPFRKG
ncbi:MAG: trypsin-like peptidase domain-containing protein [Cyclobacteriaceae bacterium]|nr:trypsin-like peptidase domain-containing protein [Cyclobacteriaceae bacterium HetDA_MAG_MS6]